MKGSLLLALHSIGAGRYPLPLHVFGNAVLVLVFGSISGFFTNLYNDLTIFALAMATFFFAWAALLFMTAGTNNERNRMHAQSALYAALAGLALAILAQTIAGLVNTAAKGQ